MSRAGGSGSRRRSSTPSGVSPGSKVSKAPSRSARRRAWVDLPLPSPPSKAIRRPLTWPRRRPGAAGGCAGPPRRAGHAAEQTCALVQQRLAIDDLAVLLRLLVVAGVDRTSAVYGKRVSVRVVLGGRRIIIIKELSYNFQH